MSFQSTLFPERESGTTTNNLSTYMSALIIDANTHILPYRARHKEEFTGYLIPWGAFVWFMPNKTKQVKADTVLQPGIFAGYTQQKDVNGEKHTWYTTCIVS